MANTVPLCLKIYPPENKELREGAEKAGLGITDYIISRATKSGAWRANRTRNGVVTAATVAAEEAAKIEWFAGNPLFPNVTSPFASLLATMIPNTDHQHELIAELALRRPDVLQASWTMKETGIDPVPLVRAALEEWQEAEPEAFLPEFSIDDLAKMLVAEDGDYQQRLTSIANRGEILAMHHAAAVRCTASQRRENGRRILRKWREAGVPWPAFEIARDGAPRLVDGWRLAFSPGYGGGVPRLVPASEIPAGTSAASIKPKRTGDEQ